MALEVAAAVARERLLAIHVAAALELIERARGEVEPRRAFEIYLRLHRVEGPEAQILAHRVLARLGSVGGVGAGELPPGPGAEEAWGAPHSLVRQIARRLRGRVHHDLRRWVERHTGRTEAALLRAHVEGAAHFARLFEGQPVARAVERYVKMVGVRPTLAEALYYLALEQIVRAEEAEPAAPPDGAAGGALVTVLRHRRRGAIPEGGHGGAGGAGAALGGRGPGSAAGGADQRQP